MSIDKKVFGISDSLVETVKEALKGGQKKIDVAPPFGKLTGADFKKLRGEDADMDNFKKNMKEGPEEKDATNPKQGSSVDPKQRSIGETSEVDEASTHRHGDTPANHERKIPAGYYWSPYNGKVLKMLTPGTKVNTKQGAGVVKSAHSSMDWDDDNDSHYIVTINGKNERIWADDLVGKKAVNPNRHKAVKGALHNSYDASLDEADDAVAKQIAAKKDAMKKQIQQKIAQKQMSTMQAKANKRLSNINASNCKCEGACKCEDKGAKGGKEPIEVNPPMKEATDPRDSRREFERPNNSLNTAWDRLKNRLPSNPKDSKRAKAGQQAGLKSNIKRDLGSHGPKGKLPEEVTQVDELDKKTYRNYLRRSHNQTLGVDAVGMGTKKSGIPGYYTGKNKDLGKDPAHKARMRKAGQALAIKKLNKENTQMDEVLDNPIKKISYMHKAYKQIKQSDPIKMANDPKKANAVANRVIGVKRVLKKLNKEEVTQVDEISALKAIRTAVKRQTAAHGAAIQRGDEPNSKEQHKINRSQALIKKKYGEKGDKIVHKAVGKRIGYED